MSTEKSKRYIIRQAGWLVFSIVLISTLSIAASLWTIHSADGDAERINIAGSLRMYSMRIALAYKNFTESKGTAGEKTEHTSLKEVMNAFEQRLYSDVFTASWQSQSQDQREKLTELRHFWQTLKQGLLEYNRPAHEVESVMRKYVGEINHFVTLIEHHSKRKITHLRWIHSLGLFFILLLSALMLGLLSKRVLYPLRRLVDAAHQVMAGNLSTRLNYRADDELGELTQAFDHMTGELEQMYHHLESRVSEQTRELRQRNHALEFLNQAASCASSHPNSIKTIHDLMQRCAEIAELQELHYIGKSRTSYAHTQSPQHFLIVSAKTGHRWRSEWSSSEPAPPHGLPIQCFQAELWQTPFETGAPPFESGELSADPEYFILPIHDQGRLYGLLAAQFANKTDGVSWQRQLLITFSDIVNKSFNQVKAQRQQQRYLLVEERSAIARELHDSIAQSLSYIKLQISRFQMMMKKGASTERLEAVSEEIRSGVNSTYAQLREVISSFRIKVSEPGLEQALKSTLSELSGRTSIHFELNYRLVAYQPAVNEEIHLLQIVREALNNVVKHASATKATIELFEPDEGSVQLNICDNGTGFKADYDSSQHHGISIMKERAALLGGALSIEGNPAEQGTCVNLVFNKPEENPDELIYF